MHPSIAPRVLTMAVDIMNLSDEARVIITAEHLGLTPTEINRMASAFEHGDLRNARASTSTAHKNGV